MARADGGLGDWTFDAAAWGARTLGGIDPIRRRLADRMEARLRARAGQPASDAAPPARDRAGQGGPRPGAPPDGRARARRAPARPAGPAGAAEDPLRRRARPPGRRHREGAVSRAPRVRRARLPRHQPGQGLQPPVRGLLRELRRARREARLRHRGPPRPRRARRLGQPVLRPDRGRALRVARGRPRHPRARRCATPTASSSSTRTARSSTTPWRGASGRSETSARCCRSKGCASARTPGAGRVSSTRSWGPPSACGGKASSSASRSPPPGTTPTRCCRTRCSRPSSTGSARSTPSSSTTCRSGAPRSSA